jgi:hypothetical protein
VMPVCGNTYRMLSDTRFNNHFEFFGTWDTHYGIYQGCGGNIPFTGDSEEGTTCC